MQQKIVDLDFLICLSYYLNQFKSPITDFYFYTNINEIKEGEPYYLLLTDDLKN